MNTELTGNTKQALVKEGILWWKKSKTVTLVEIRVWDTDMGIPVERQTYWREGTPSEVVQARLLREKRILSGKL